MLRATELAGFVGVALAGAAYVPQIWHLIRQQCSAGLSRVAFAVWLVSSLLVTTHALASGETVFIALGFIQLTATTLILVYATKYAGSFCATHFPARELPVTAELAAVTSASTGGANEFANHVGEDRTVLNVGGVMRPEDPHRGIDRSARSR